MKKFVPRFHKTSGRWYIIFPIKNGKPLSKREYFKDKAMAEKRCCELNSQGVEFSLPSTIFKKYLLSQMLLDVTGAKIDILEIVRKYLKMPHKETEEKPILEAFEDYVKEKKQVGIRENTMKDYGSVLNWIKSLSVKYVCQIEKNNMVTFVNSHEKWSARTKHNNFNRIRSFLNFCKENGWLSFNPTYNAYKQLPKKGIRINEIYEVDTIESLFKNLESQKKWNRYIPYFALLVFCGCRPYEAKRIDWSLIDLKNNKIKITPEITKTRDEGIIHGDDLPDCIWHWLRKYKTDSWEVPCDYTARVIIKSTGVKQTITDGFRHSFTSYYYAKTENLDLVRRVLRHTNPKTIYQHYLNTRPRKLEGERYFNIYPK